MFATLFLGAVLAVFLTIGVVRGDAETGLLQPLVVRPLGRATMLVARWVPARRLRPRSTRSSSTRSRSRSRSRARRLDARPRRHRRACCSRLGGGDDRGDLGAGLGLHGLDRAGDRRLHGLRRRLVAGLLGQIGDAIESDTLDADRRASPATRCRSRRSTSRASTCSRPTTPGSRGTSSSSGRSAAPSHAGGWLLFVFARVHGRGGDPGGRRVHAPRPLRRSEAKRSRAAVEAPHVRRSEAKPSALPLRRLM